ncbi:hypothetical protein [Aphanothece hegewaldii]|uniref:hypothetical protein n=1 Tax=Aphanothece hegewaldii TaxID=1521625 RepID=UPI0015E76229|nr:hypothetical protein [Aphanothece hegewaldii]
MTHHSLNQQELEDLLKLSEQLDEKLKVFNDESAKIALKWQIWAEKKHKSTLKSTVK